MDIKTIRHLNAINREFYRVTADEFDVTRGQAWDGWNRLLPFLTAPLHVLDVGCGNGRFGAFLAENIPGEICYHGIDSSTALLEHARETLKAYPAVEATLTEIDIIESSLPPGDYDLVVLFGVLHHIPGAAHRLDFMQRLAEQVKPGGLLVFAAWCFYEFERFRERIVPWSADIAIEKDDYLLDWRRGERALRYCHYVDETEHAALIAATDCIELLTFRADGVGDAMNRYSILQKS